MDILYFLRKRTRFIRQLYDTSAAPILEIVWKIEAGEEPYEPPYSDNGEPPFQEEWMDAQASLEILGLACVSLLSESLKLYFLTWEGELDIKCQSQFGKEFKQGFLNGYRACFGCLLGASWDKCPANFDILEQVILARNRGQHPDSILEMGVNHSGSDREKYPMPFFILENERKMLEAGSLEDELWMPLFLRVTRKTLFEAIEQVEVLCDWLEEQMFDLKYQRQGASTRP